MFIFLMLLFVRFLVCFFFVDLTNGLADDCHPELKIWLLAIFISLLSHRCLRGLLLLFTHRNQFVSFQNCTCGLWRKVPCNRTLCIGRRYQSHMFVTCYLSRPFVVRRLSVGEPATRDLPCIFVGMLFFSFGFVQLSLNAVYA